MQNKNDKLLPEVKDIYFCIENSLNTLQTQGEFLLNHFSKDMVFEGEHNIIAIIKIVIFSNNILLLLTSNHFNILITFLV